MTKPAVVQPGFKPAALDASQPTSVPASNEPASEYDVKPFGSHGDEVERRSHWFEHAKVDAEIVNRLRDFAAAVVLSKLHDHVEDINICAPMGNPPVPELMYNTKLSVQYSRKPTCTSTALLRELCARCAGHELPDDTPIGGRFQCPTCDVTFTRKYAYEVGSGKSSIGRNPSQLKIFDFTPEMEQLVASYEEESCEAETYTHVTLVIYLGCQFCANCVLAREGLRPHGSKVCHTILKGHRDIGGGVNSQVERSITRTLSVGGTRILGLEMRSRDTEDQAWVMVPDTEVDFPLYDGSMFVLDTDDEEQRMRRCPDGSDVNGAWFHGMMQPVGSDEISCGFIARKVRCVRDVCCMTDVVIETRMETAKYDAVARMWKETWAPVYKRSTGALVKSAIRKWNKRESQRRRH